jgi:hypothetical protein
MIVKIAARGTDPGKLMAYLASEKNHHCNQRIVAGSVQYPGQLDKALVAQVSADLRAYQQLTGTQSKRGHIYHVTLALAPGEGPLSDNQWEALADDFMDGMGFTGANKSPVKWTAVNHGANAAGADHVHIVMSTIRQNGSQVSLHNDMLRASKLATKLEQAHGLTVMASRLATVGAGSVPYTGREVEAARQQGKVEPTRVTLEREIRALAAASTSEAEFVRRIRADGILLRPYPPTGPVTGYSVAEPAAKPEWLGGGKLARDLTLPQLRRRWPEGGAVAEKEWRFGRVDAPVVKRGRETQAVAIGHGAVDAVAADLTAVGEKLRTATPEDLAELSHEVAGTLAAASKALEPVPGALAKASRDVGGWAQPRQLGTERRPVNHAGRGMALLLIQAMNPGSAQSTAIMLKQLAELVIALYRLHQAARLVAGVGRSVRPMSIDEGQMQQGLTVAATAAAQWADNKRRAIQAPPTDKPFRGGDAEMWDASTIREDRVNAAVRKARENFVPPPPRATREQIERIGELAEKVELAGVAEAAAGLPRDEVDRLIAQFEASVQTFATEGCADQMITDPELDTVLGGHDLGLGQQKTLDDIMTPEAAVAFEDDLVRKAQERGSSVEPVVVEGTVSTPDPAPAVAAAEPDRLVGQRDPRTWPTAGDEVTSKQRWTLKEAGFTAEEIATLRKGSASYVIGSADHRAAFTRNAADQIRHEQGPARSARKPSDVRGSRTLPATDIRQNRPKPKQ